jgi:hypothetical protein
MASITHNQAVAVSVSMLLGLMDRMLDEPDDAVNFIADVAVHSMAATGVCPHCVIKTMVNALRPTIEDGIKSGDIVDKQKDELRALLTAFAEEDFADMETPEVTH